jgi:hypothetical protein
MKSTLYNLLFCAVLAISHSACKKEEATTPAADVSIVSNFEAMPTDWSITTVDIPLTTASLYKTSLEIRTLPAPLSQTTKALFIVKDYPSYVATTVLSKPIENLKPNTKYHTTVSVRLASAYPLSAFGIGGNPATSVILKATVVPTKPTVQENDATNTRTYSVPNSQYVTLGNIGTTLEDNTYQLISRTNASQDITFTTDSQGKAWFVLAVSSGFEGATAL